MACFDCKASSCIHTFNSVWLYVPPRGNRLRKMNKFFIGWHIHHGSSFRYYYSSVIRKIFKQTRWQPRLLISCWHKQPHHPLVRELRPHFVIRTYCCWARPTSVFGGKCFHGYNLIWTVQLSIVHLIIRGWGTGMMRNFKSSPSAFNHRKLRYTVIELWYWIAEVKISSSAHDRN